MADVNEVEAALAIHEAYLSSLPNVVGLGIVSRDEAKPMSTDVVLGVYVSRKLPRERLSAEEIIPQVIELESKGRALNIDVRVIEQGLVQTENVITGKEVL